MGNIRLLVVEKQSQKEHIDNEHDGKPSVEQIRKMRIEHERHRQTCEQLYAYINKHREVVSLQKVYASHLTQDIFTKNWDAVVVLGGDGTFLNTAMYIRDIPVIPINSDPQRSVGALMRYTPQNMEEVLDAFIFSKKYKLDSWPRLTARIKENMDGVDFKDIHMHAINEIICGIPNIRQTTTMHVVVEDPDDVRNNRDTRHEVDNNRCQHNGIIIATPQGSTGQYQSFAGTPFAGHFMGYYFFGPYGQLREIEKKYPGGHLLHHRSIITIESYCHGMELSMDGERNVHKLDMGNVVEICFSKYPLKIVRPD